MEKQQSTDNPDMTRERGQASFDVEKMTYEYDGDEEQTRTRRELQRMGIANPKLKDPIDTMLMDRPEQYDNAMRKTANLLSLYNELGLKEFSEVRGLRNMAFPFEPFPAGLHLFLFMPTITSNATEEQKQRWLPKCHTFEMIGTYGQTEMGHGTHLRGLETTATYDPQHEEFIINSPTATSIKYWPGGLGHTTNHAMVMAQLYTNGRCYGPHPFMVQTRSMEDHKPLPGITAGDIGPKFGWGSMDNGFLKMDNVRVHRTNMLARHSEVLKDGTYSQKGKGSKKPEYAVMVSTRATLVDMPMTASIAAAVTVAVRYSAVRRQSGRSANGGDGEAQVLDFQTQQYKLLPVVAMTYAFKFTAAALKREYLRLVEEGEAGNYSSMPDMHALTAGLKAFTACDATAAVEQCRLACGGHGYSLASGLAKIYHFIAPSATYEGENTVMYLQTARYLVKAFQRARDGDTLTGSVAYLNQKAPGKCDIGPTFTAESLIKAYEYRARRLVARAVTRLQKRQAEGAENYRAWNMSSVDSAKAAEAHCHLYIVAVFARRIEEMQDAAIVKVMRQVFLLYALYGLTKHQTVFMEDGFMSGAQVGLVGKQLLSLLADIRPNAVALVDSFDLPDRLLGSALGRFDGHVYEYLYKWANDSPLNRSEVHSSFSEHLHSLVTEGPDAKL